MAEAGSVRAGSQAQFDAPRTVPQLDGVRVLVLFGGSELFGQERANIEVFSVLEELGLKARFVISPWGEEQIRPELERRGFEISRAPYGFHWGRDLLGRRFHYLFRNVAGLIATSWRVWREARTWRATHIYVPNWTHYIYGSLGVALAGVPLIFRAGDELPQHTRFHRWSCRKLFNQVSLLVWNTEFLRKKHVTAGLSKEKARIIYNHPPDRIPGTSVGVPETTPDDLVVLFIGQISQHKGAHVFVDAARAVVARRPDAVFWLVGKSTWGDPLADQLKLRVASAETGGRIQFLGYHEDIPQLLRAAHIHVCPSIWDEPSPNVVLEAKREGVPSVAFPVGGIPELIEHEIDGYICRDRTVEALVEGIEHFANNPGSRKRAGAAAQRSLEKKFGRTRFQREWADVFLATRVPAGAKCGQSPTDVRAGK